MRLEPVVDMLRWNLKTFTLGKSDFRLQKIVILHGVDTSGFFGQLCLDVAINGLPQSGHGGCRCQNWHAGEESLMSVPGPPVQTLRNNAHFQYRFDMAW
jgi:hypothetical protein